MIRIQRWLLDRQKIFHYVILAMSAIILLCCIAITTSDRDIYRVVLQALSMLLFGSCFLYIRAWHQFTRYEHYSKRICYEYLRVIHKQSYKIDRLSKTESEVLGYLLNDYTIQEIALRMQTNYEKVYQHIAHLREKLEVSRKEGLLDIDFSTAF